METKKCRKCHTDIPSEAKKCSQCQSDQRNWFIRNPIKSILLFIFIGIPFLSGVFGIGGDKQENTNTSQTTGLETVLGTYVVDGNLGDGLDTMDITLWKSYEDREMVAQVPNGSEVGLLERRTIGDILYKSEGGYQYCKVRYQNHIGWFDCAWIER